MGKWIAGILATVIGGVLLAYAMNWFGPTTGGGDGGDHGISVMGPLEVGINRQGLDFDNIGKVAANAPDCAQLCLDDANCDAMTYVSSTRRCWLKSGVPATSANVDMISSVKMRK